MGCFFSLPDLNKEEETIQKILERSTLFPDEIAIYNLIFFDSGLSRSEISTYLFNDKFKPTNQKVLELYINSFGFNKVPVDEALRLLFSKIICPEQPYYFDLLISFFSKKYASDNHKKTIAIYTVTTYSLLLNFELHKGAGMTLDHYVKEITLKTNFSEKELTKIYENIKDIEIKVR